MRCSCLCSVAWAAAGYGESTADALPALLMALPCRLGSQLLSKACGLFAFSGSGCSYEVQSGSGSFSALDARGA